MTRPREPFVSGLPGRDLRPPAMPLEQAAVLVLLDKLAQWASENVVALAPVCADRFDGAERIPADPDAQAEQRMFAAVAQLALGVKRDPLLLAHARRFLEGL